jgi:PAS domain S-box-containing protein
MSKEEYIKSEIDKGVQFWLGWTLFSAALFFIIIALLDYVSTPENFNDFIKIRLIGALLCVFLSILNRKKVDRKYQLYLVYITLIVCGIIIEYMILRFGGHSSTYYAGFFLVALYGIGFVPLDLKHSLSFAFLALLIYAIPILIFDSSINLSYFITPLFFLISTFSSLIIWRAVSQKRLMSELGLQYDLDQQKKRLEAYSHQLEDMVQERTKDLQKSEQQQRALFDYATDGIVVMDRDGIIVNVNNKTCEMHGYSKEELIGISIWQLEAESDPDISQDRMKRILAGESVVFETTQLKKDGTHIPLEISSKAVAVGDVLLIQSFYRDLTEKKRLQSHLIQSQKMESIGMLAGGIAHDFNNVLTAILGHTEIVRLFPSLDAKSLRSLQVIEDAARKAGSTITKLLGFARRSNVEILPINLNDVVHDTLKMLERALEKNINFELKLEEHLPVVKGDFSQLEQVIMNLIVNAKDAMPKGGSIVLATTYRETTKDMPDIPHYVRPGKYVQLSVTDTGTGIPDDIAQKIFDPFFTTKERGKGTGLGLSMCYGTMMEHKGYITVQSQVGSGSTFTILLPVASAAAPSAPKQAPAPTKGSETILVVDDEDDILSAVQETLTASGYKVLTANDPTLGLDVFKKMPRDIALVITDMVMPKMDGKELMEQLRKINPEIKMLAISGYMKAVAEKSDIKNTAWFLQKPFESRNLLVQIRRILDSRSHNPSRINA